jgi:predicted enzyme related to lactoylglutathione lyase
MPDSLQHFAINCDHVERAIDFYRGVFGWNFEPWGPPGFFQSADAGGVRCAIQPRRELVPGVRMTGMECTFAVDDIDATQAAVEKLGGKVVMPKVTIPNVGTLIFFQDSEGNLLGAMQYESAAKGARETVP